MPSTKANVTYKKKEGSLTVSDDIKYVFWTPSAPPGASPTVTIPIADITNLQQTPATQPKVALKVVVKEDSYVFSFTHATDARKEQEGITDTLRDRIAALKAGTAASLAPAASSGPAPNADDGGRPAAMAIAKAVSSAPTEESWYDDSKLMDDHTLQKSLLESNKNLRERFHQSIKDKPETVSISQLTGQFWSTRLHLLRAHAVELAQKQGEYNVLPEIKFVRKPAEKEGEPDTKQLSITKEQIKLIFKQYPVVWEAYNAHSPPLSAGEFWTRFFNSRLLKKLKGEKIMQYDPTDAIFDRYLDRPEGGPASVAHIPLFIDLEGNEQNHSQRKGNRPDLDMRPSSIDKIPILRVLNNLSEKMMSHVAPEDGEAHAPIGVDEAEFEQLRLRDLARNDVDNRVRLNVKEQQRYVADSQDDLSAEAKLYARQDPQNVLSTVRSNLQSSNLGSDKQGTLRLDRALGFKSDDESDSEDETQNKKKGSARAPRVGSRAALATASQTMFASIKKQAQAESIDLTSLNGLSQATFDTLTITHNTTTEFLHYFWTIFLSGDASRSKELEQLVTTLDRSIDRINAVGEAAEAERNKKIQALEKQIQELYRKTGKKRRVDYNTMALGGKKVVDAMIRPTVVAVAHATAAYRKALEEQTRENGAA